MSWVFKPVVRDEDTMNNHRQYGSGTYRWGTFVVFAFTFALIIVGTLSAVHADEMSEKSFATPEQAADALASAWHSGTKDDLIEIFGSAGEMLVNSGDPIAEKHARERLAASFDKAHRIEIDGDRKATLILGDDAWPYPIPLVKQGAEWRFDVKAGAEQILDRRIGRNELNAIRVSRAYVGAQQDYAVETAADDNLHEYAQKVVSSQGKHDGLYWRAVGSDKESPLGPLVATAESRGYGTASAQGRAPFQGYYYKILTQQGKAAPGGAKSYIVDGHMTGGFALLAYPAKYGDSGIMTFIVNQNGVVFEKNLGPATAQTGAAVTVYDPDETWKAVGP